MSLPAKVYFSVGEQDSPSMTGDLTELEKHLNAKPFAQLNSTFVRYPDRDHFNVAADAFGDGLAYLFPNAVG